MYGEPHSSIRTDRPERPCGFEGFVRSVNTSDPDEMRGVGKQLRRSKFQRRDEKTEQDGAVSEVQPKIDAAVKRGEEFEQSTHLKPGDEHRRVVI